MQKEDGSGNFNAFNDGHPCNPSTAITGYSYARGLIDYANDRMDVNPPLNLAPGSALTPIPKRIQWVLDGVYFDQDTVFRQGVGPNSSPIHDYAPLCINADSVINIFITEEWKWPYLQGRCQVDPAVTKINRGYILPNNQANCATGSVPAKLWAVVGSPWTNYILNGPAIWDMATNLNHELCHALGLNHPFQGISNCADAPTHPDYPNFLQCWNHDPNNPYCDAWSKVSNNLMDYNAHQSSLSPCQIGIMQDNLNSCLQSRYVYKCDNCRPTRASFSLLHGYRTGTPIPGRPGSGFWLDGRASFNHNSFKIEIDEVFNLGFGSGLRKHYEKTESREVGLENIGSLYNFVNGRTYQVILRTYNGCGSAAVHVETFEYHNLSQVSRSSALAAPIIANPLSSSTRHE